MRQKGFTYVERIILLALIVILSLLAYPGVRAYIEGARVSTDNANLRILNDSTSIYDLSESIDGDDCFEGLTTDAARQQRLIDAGILSRPIMPLVNDRSFVWRIESQTWEYVRTPYFAPNGLDLDFGEDTTITLPFKGADYILSTNDWEITSEGLSGTSGSVFFENGHPYYTITLDAVLAETGKDGGYGVYLETIIHEDGSLFRDSGYILQFDRGYGSGALVLRPRHRSFERSPVMVTTTAIRDRSIDPTWWLTRHTLKITVKPHPADHRRKLIDVWVDDEIAFENVIIDANLESVSTVTGIRAWDGLTSIKEFSLIAEDY